MALKAFLFKSRSLWLVVLVLLGGIDTQAQVPPVGWWTFEPGQEVNDLAKNFSKLQLHGASVDDGKLILDSGAYAISSTYKGPNIGTNKTLVAWIRLDALEGENGWLCALKQKASNNYEGIGFAPDTHAAASWFITWNEEGRKFNKNQLYTEKEIGQWIQLTLVYKKIGREMIGIYLYRNGELIRRVKQTFRGIYYTGNTEFVFGNSLMDLTGGNGWLRCSIDEVMLFNKAMETKEFVSLRPKKAVQPRPEPKSIGTWVWVVFAGLVLLAFILIIWRKD